MRKPGKGMLAAAARGAAFFGGTGAVLGGAAGTVAWPVVGTSFGAAGGAAAGALTGVLASLALTVTVSGATRTWPTRVVPAFVALAAELAGVRLCRGGIGVPVPAGAVLMVLGVVAAAAAGPLIAHGVRPAAATAGPAPPALTLVRVSWLMVAGGAGAGGCAGALTGLIIGVAAYLPTAPFAAVEGAVFGSVTGASLACLVAGLTVLPRMRARR